MFAIMEKQIKATKTSYHHGDLRPVLLDQAALMIREEGERALSMRKLAVRVGVSRAAPYHHFADKQALLCAIAEEGFRRFKKLDYQEELDQGMIAYDCILKYMLGYVKFASEHPEYYDLMFGGHLWTSEKLTESLVNQAHESFKRNLGTIQHWQEKGYISPDIDPLRYYQVNWSTMHGISRLLIDQIYVSNISIETICKNAAIMHWEQLTGRKYPKAR